MLDEGSLWFVLLFLEPAIIISMQCNACFIHDIFSIFTQHLNLSVKCLHQINLLNLNLFYKTKFIKAAVRNFCPFVALFVWKPGMAAFCGII